MDAQADAEATRLLLLDPRPPGPGPARGCGIPPLRGEPGNVEAQRGLRLIEGRRRR